LVGLVVEGLVEAVEFISFAISFALGFAIDFVGGVGFLVDFRAGLVGLVGALGAIPSLARTIHFSALAFH
jgi:hypothetical protein